MENFTPIASTIGGVLIGLSAALMMLANGRVAGISGIFSGVLLPKAGEFGWRALFTVGLVVGGLIMFFITPESFAMETTPGRSLPLIALAGLIVGFGTRLGSGCTSGHGVCGLARLSPRSLVATLTFMATAVATVVLMNIVLGGGV